MRLVDIPEDIKRDPKTLISLIRKDSQLFAETLLKVRDGVSPEKPIVPFVYNTPQTLFHQAIEKQKAKQGRVRIITLKARKMGISTQIQGRAYQMASQQANTACKIISHDDESVSGLFAISQLFQEEMPEGFRPQTKYSNRIEMLFANPDKDAPADQKGLRSRISLDSAKNTSAGRSSTLHFLHLSEVAFWQRDPDKLCLGLLNSMPKANGTEAYMESTANGAEGFFYEFWQDSMKGVGGWEAFFLPWWQMESYRAEPEHVLTYDSEELRLKERFNLDDFQLAWRRQVLKEDCRGEKVKFFQEFPAEWSEAFQSSGANFFPFENLLAIKSIIEKLPKPLRGVVQRGADGVIKFVEDEEGHTVMHKPPNPNMAYAVTCDTSEGTQDADHDPSGLLVNTCPANMADLDEEVMEYSGFLSPDELADYMILVGEFYNWAFINWEENGIGLVLSVRVTDVSYPSYYQRQHYDETNGVLTQKAGFKTTASTKPMILSFLKADLRDGRCMPKTIAAWEQFVSFKRSKVAYKGGLFSGNAEKNKHDEAIICRALMRETLRSAPRATAQSQAVYSRDLESYYSRR